MAGLLDFAMYDDPASVGRLAFGAGLLNAAGPSKMPISFGQALASGLMGAQSASTEAAMNKRRNALVDLQMQQRLAEMEEAKRRQTEDAGARALMQQFTQTPGQQAASLPGGPTQANAAMIPQMPGGFDSAGMRQAAMQSGNLRGVELASQLAAQKKSPLVLSEGQSALDPDTYRPLATNPKKPSLPSGVQEYQFAVSQGYKGTFEQWDTARKRAGATNVNVPINTGQKGFDNTLKLRGDFRSEPIYKAHGEVQSAHAQITAALKQNSPAGDLAAATKIMKILDPGSVVRESELGMAMAASGLMDRVVNYADMTLRGTKLTPTQREDFKRLADALSAESKRLYSAKETEYRGLAQTIDLNPDHITGMPKQDAGTPQVRRYNPVTGKIE